MLEIGSIIDGKYKVLNKIGQGGMSIVYLAMNERANKQWAIKEVRKDGVKDFDVVKQGLLVEIDLLKRLNHPHLPSIIDVIEQKDNFLIVMDYIQGIPLSKTLEEYGAQPQDKVIEWAKQLTDVLGYLHTRNPAIIYRDMKPANVMLTPSGNLTLIDFGTAREYKERNVADTTYLGTIGYAAPEQFGGQGQTDARTDIYCLGATLYHLVTGMNPCEPPYEIRPIREINPSLSSGLEKIIMKCTQRNPEDRYQNCDELMYALEHYDEIDDLYYRKQKKHLAMFCAAVFGIIAFVIAGFITENIAESKNDENYEYVLNIARRSKDELEKRKRYKEAILIKPTAKEAYSELIETYISGEGNGFSLEEESEFKEVINVYESQLKKSNEDYMSVCYQAGILYWYYYEYGKTEGMSDNQDNRIKFSLPWFQIVVSETTEEEFQNYSTAKIYYEIGMFMRDISNQEKLGSDKGKYLDYWKNINQIIQIVKNEKSQNQNAKLELYKLFFTTIDLYCGKLKEDGVQQEDLLNSYYDVQDAVEKMEVFAGTETEVIKKYIQNRYDTVERKIKQVYH